MMHNLFVYGTLCRSEVYEDVTGEPYPETCPASLAGYGLGRPVQGYPAIWSNPNAAMEGTLLLDLSEDILQKLDKYEGDAYKRVRVTVMVEDQPREAFVYTGK